MAPLPRCRHAAEGDVRTAHTPSPPGNRPARTVDDTVDCCMIGRQTLCPPRSVLRIRVMRLGGSICGAAGRCRRLLLDSHERRRRGGNSSLVLHHRGNEIASGSAPPWCVAPPERRPSPRRRSGERDSTRCCGRLERLPGHASDVGIGGDRLLGDSQQGRPTVGPSWQRQSGTRGLPSHPARRSQSSSRRPSKRPGLSSIAAE